MAPPPSTIIEAGSTVVSTASWLVQKGTWSSPAIGGTAGLLPVATTTPRVAA